MAGQALNDLWRDWLLGAIPLQDKQNDFLDFNNSPLNPTQYNDVRYSVDHLLANGSLYYWSDVFSLAAAASITYSFVTETADPFVLASFNSQFTSGGNPQLQIQAFVGGTVSGGVIVPNVFPRNHNAPTASPYNGDVFRGRTVDVAGALFAEKFLLESGGSVAGGGVILQESTTYYITVTNNGNQTADGIFEMLAGADRL